MKQLLVILLIALGSLNVSARTLEVDWSFDDIGRLQCEVLEIDGKPLNSRFSVEQGLCDLHAVESVKRPSKQNPELQLCFPTKLHGQQITRKVRPINQQFCTL